VSPLFNKAAKDVEAIISSAQDDGGIRVYLRGNLRPHPCAHAIQITKAHESRPETMPLWVRYHVTTRPDQPGKLFWGGFNDRVFPGDWLVAYHCGSPFGLLVDAEAFHQHYTTDAPLGTDQQAEPRPAEAPATPAVPATEPLPGTIRWNRDPVCVVVVLLKSGNQFARSVLKSNIEKELQHFSQAIQNKPGATDNGLIYTIEAGSGISSSSMMLANQIEAVYWYEKQDNPLDLEYRKTSLDVLKEQREMLKRSNKKEDWEIDTEGD